MGRLLIRILSGERLRKPTPRESQCFSGVFALIAVYFALLFVFMNFDTDIFDFMNSDGPFGLVAVWTTVISVLCLIGWFWGKYVPSKVSYALAAVLWPILFLLALTGHIGR